MRQRIWAQLELSETENELTQLYEHAPCGYHSLDAEGIVIRMNETELDWLGRSGHEVVGKARLADLISPACRREFNAAFASVKDSGAKSDIESELVRKNGTLLPVHVSAVAVRDRDGRFLRSRASVFDITARKEAEQKARHYALQLQALSRRLVEVQDHERRWLAGELHDRIGQNLTALNINLNTIKCGLSSPSRERIGARLEDCLHLVDATVDSTFDLMTELRPAILDDYGLVASLQWYGEQFTKRTGVVAVVSGKEPDPRLTQMVETTLFRIAQEACTNVAKYAKAREVIIALQTRPERIRLDIADDGCGFDPDGTADFGTRSGWGLLIMRERAESVGGHLRIQSRAGQGARITVEIQR